MSSLCFNAPRFAAIAIAFVASESSGCAIVEENDIPSVHSTAAAVWDAGSGETAAQEIPIARSGDRLLAMHFAAPGVDQFRSFRDTHLDIDCTWAPSETGTMRCFPLDEANIVYLDTSCTQPAVTRGHKDAWRLLRRPSGDRVVEPPGREGAIVSAEVELAGLELMCPDSSLPMKRAAYRVREKLFEVGNQGARRDYYELNNGSCWRRTFEQGWSPEVYRLDTVDETTFASGSVKNIALSEHLALRRIVGADGSEFTLGASTDGRPCQLLSGTCVPGRWTTEPAGLPPGFAYTPAYTDAQCTDLAFSYRTACGKPDYGIVNAGPSVRVFELRPATKAFVKLSAASGSTPTCEARSSTEGLFERAREVTSMLPRANRVSVGQGPLYRELMVAPSSDIFVPLEQGWSFFGTQGYCDVIRADDGSLRCFPTRNWFSEANYWSDAECAHRLLSFRGSDRDLVDLLIADEAPGQLTLLKRLSRAEIHLGPTYTLDGGTCVLAAKPQDRRLLKRGNDVPLSVLPEIELVAR